MIVFLMSTFHTWKQSLLVLENDPSSFFWAPWIAWKHGEYFSSFWDLFTVYIRTLFLIKTKKLEQKLEKMRNLDNNSTPLQCDKVRVWDMFVTFSKYILSLCEKNYQFVLWLSSKEVASLTKKVKHCYCTNKKTS